VYLFQTVHFAASHGYYLLHSSVISVPGGKGALMMYIGALLWAVSIGAAILQIIWSFLGVGRVIKRWGRKTKEVPREAAQKVERSVRRRYLVKLSQSLPTVLRFIKGLGLTVPERQEIAYSAVGPGNGALTAVAGGGAVFGTGGFGGANPLQTTTGNWENELHDMGLSIESITRMQSVVGWMILPFLGQWLFWVGLVNLFGDR
jgi:hypothetical protein